MKLLTYHFKMKRTYLSISAAVAIVAGSLAMGSIQAEEKPEKKPDDNVGEEIAAALAKQEKMLTAEPDASSETEKASDKVSLKEGEEKKEEALSPRDMALKDHHEQLKIYDLDENGKISEKEWKAANKKDTDRNEKFYLVDKDKDGEIDDDEALKFLMQRISLESTFLGGAADNGTENIIDDGIEEHAPSELRVTLFSIPIGD